VPIRPEQRALYPKDWKAISKRIREERAGNRCERCKAPNGKSIARGAGSDAGTYMLEDGEVFDAETGRRLGMARGSEYEAARFTRIVLTVAHLDHDPTNNADENLKALCQRCHLSHDREQHTANARATRRSRKASRELF
jgi:5-methylcytosine-specific restriction endonuclease McrA